MFRPEPEWQAWRSAVEWNGRTMPLVERPRVSLAGRGVPYPEFTIIESKAIAAGSFEVLDPIPARRYYGFHPKDFGETKAHPEIFPCNQLPGNMLRIEILSRYGETARIHHEALGYWQMMAETTGTLWEHDKPQASCNHGFAAHAAVVLRRDILGLRTIDHQAKTVEFAVPDNPLDHCRGSFPIYPSARVTARRRSACRWMAMTDKNATSSEPSNWRLRTPQTRLLIPLPPQRRAMKSSSG